jgi:hypothetical protein
VEATARQGQPPPAGKNQIPRNELLAPGVFEVEFCDNDGRTYASLALRSDQLMVLHYRPLQVA